MIRDALAAVGYVATVAGVWIQAGIGAALIAAGLPLVVGYVLLEVRLGRNLRRR
jgi:choline-glycine betaine transporter